MEKNVLNQSSLSINQIKIFNKINFKNNKKIEKLLENIIKLNKSDSNLILSPIISRDQLQTRFFSDLNFLSLVDYLVKKKKIKKIIVNNLFLKSIIRKKHQSIKVTTSSGLQNLIFDFLNIFYSFFKLTIYSLVMMFSRNAKNRVGFTDKNIILIETFFSNNLISQGNFTERYQSNVYKKLPQKLKKKSFFFPINLSILHIFKFIKISKKNNLKFIHPMDFLLFKDYLDSIFYIPKLKLFNLAQIKFENYNISKIIRYHHLISFFNFSSFIAILNKNFLKRLKKNNIKIDLIIDWYENQIIDKGLCLGKNKYFPKCKIKGHMGFINDFRNIHYYRPILLEKKLSALPDEILLISKKINKIYFSKLKFIKSRVVPAMRNQTLFNFKLNLNFKNKNKKNILIILSANPEESNFIFRILKNISNDIDFKKNNFIIKPHVNTKINKFIIKSKNFKISYDNFYKLLNESDIVISGGTTASIEAQILNKKLILIGNNKGVTINPLLKQSEKKIDICYDGKNLLKHIEKLSNKNQKIMINKKLLNSYFVKFNQKSFSNFYN